MIAHLKQRVVADKASIAAFVFIGIQLLWRGWYVARGYFTQDDFLVLDLAHDKALGDLLLFDYAGHILPARWLLAELVVRGGTLAWWLAAVLIIGFMLVAALLAWVVLCRLLPGRWLRLPVLAFFLFSPLLMWPTQQWIVAMQFYPLTILFFLGVLSLLRRIDGGGRIFECWPALLLALALLFQERALLFPLAYAGLVLTLMPGRPTRRVITAIRKLWVLWVSLIAVVVGYVVLHALSAPIQPRSVTGNGDAGSTFGNYLFRTVLPGLVGGPWQFTSLGGAVLVPPTWCMLVSLAVVGTALLLIIRSGGSRSVWAFTMAGTYALAGFVLLFGGRTQFGSAIGLVPRYASDLVPVLTVALALALHGVRSGGLPAWAGWFQRRVESHPRTVAVLAAAVVGLVTVPTTVQLAEQGQHRAERTYATNLVREIRADPQVVIFDGRPPSDVLINWFGDRARVSTVLGTMDPSPRFDVPGPGVQIPDATGRLRPIALQQQVASVPATNRACGHPIRATPTTLPMTEVVPAGRKAAKIDYFTNTPTSLTIQFMSGATTVQTDRIRVTRGLHALFVPIGGSFDAVDMKIDNGRATVCVGRVVAGSPTAHQP